MYLCPFSLWSFSLVFVYFFVNLCEESTRVRRRVKEAELGQRQLSLLSSYHPFKLCVVWTVILTHL